MELENLVILLTAKGGPSPGPPCHSAKSSGSKGGVVLRGAFDSVVAIMQYYRALKISQHEYRLQ